MATRQIPLFLLKGIDPKKILVDYQSGFFNRKPVPKEPIAVAQHTTYLAPIYGNTNESAIYSIRDRNNNNVVMATTHHNDFEVFRKGGGELKVGGRCDVCKQDFKNIAVGYPVAYREMCTLTCEDGDPNNMRYRVVYAFWVEGEFCTFQCAMYYVRNLLGLPADCRSSNCNESEEMLNMLYRLTYPNGPELRPSQEPKLLLANKGSLSNEQWTDQRHVYIKTDRVLMVPIKTEYIQQQFNAPVIAIDTNADEPVFISGG